MKTTKKTSITIIGGVYHEETLWPSWDHVYGSGGRAAAALSGYVDNVILKACYGHEISKRFAKNIELYKFKFEPEGRGQSISFDYIHSLSAPTIRPTPSGIRRQKDISVSAPAVLRFGMMETTAKVTADYCVYDPQSAFNPEPFGKNGSVAKHLAIVANRSEVLALANTQDFRKAARKLLSLGAEVVVVKSGIHGAYVFYQGKEVCVPAYKSNYVFTVGSGDVFAATFAAEWGVFKRSPIDAARAASQSVSIYVNNMSLPIPRATLHQRGKFLEVKPYKRKIYLAGPFFTLSQRWLIDESLRCLKELGLSVFSPVHDVGRGNAEDVVERDLAGLNDCDAVFAILDGLDSGTIFEVGYAKAKNIPVYGLAQTVSEEDIKMLTGSGCRIYEDFVTAVHHIAWKI
jgi:hypothetical protein